MSVFRPDEFERELQRSADDYRPADICFKCGEVLSSDEHLIVVSGIEGSPFLTDAEAYDGLCRPSPPTLAARPMRTGFGYGVAEGLFRSHGSERPVLRSPRQIGIRRVIADRC